MAGLGQVLLQFVHASVAQDVAIPGCVRLRPPPPKCAHTPGEARLPSVHTQLLERDEFIMEIRSRLLQAQQHYKMHYDRKHRPLEFEAGQWVWLRLLHRPMASLDVHGRGKLGPKFYGSFQVEERIGEVAYKLKLPEGGKLHNVFHVGLLKKFNGDPLVRPASLPPTRHGWACPEPAKAVKSRLAHGRQEVLIRWKGQVPADASWVDLEEFRYLYPAFQLTDELILQGGRDVMLGVHYNRRPKKEVGTGGANKPAE
jgi:hypothetical protein